MTKSLASFKFVFEGILLLPGTSISYHYIHIFNLTQLEKYDLSFWSSYSISIIRLYVFLWVIALNVLPCHSFSCWRDRECLQCSIFENKKQRNRFDQVFHKPVDTVIIIWPSLSIECDWSTWTSQYIRVVHYKGLQKYSSYLVSSGWKNLFINKILSKQIHSDYRHHFSKKIILQFIALV